MTLGDFTKTSGAQHGTNRVKGACSQAPVPPGYPRFNLLHLITSPLSLRNAVKLVLELNLLAAAICKHHPA